MKLLYAFSHLLNNSAVKTPCADLNLYKEIYLLDADGWLVDRTGQVEFPIGSVLDARFQLPESFAACSFEHACLERAKALVSENTPIYVLWSGGIDSTAMLCAFLSAGINLDQICVVLNNDSVKEYRMFYEQQIRGKLRIAVTEEFMLKICSGRIDGIVLSGEHGDQLFGSPMINSMHQNMPKGFLSKRFDRSNFSQLMASKKISDTATNCWFDMYAKSATQSPRPIDTMFDFAWWHGFNFRWQAIGLKMMPRIHEQTDLRTFYSGAEFQAWSVHHCPDLDSLDSLKSQPKKFIFSVSGDQSYLDHKIKHPSSTLYYGKPAAAAIDQARCKISADRFDIFDYYQPRNSIAEWLESN